MDFVEFPKIPRFSRDIVITEKIDGTNASILITDSGEIYAGSRTRWITPQNDNYGFAAWVQENTTELLRLGPGHHFGEWFGRGIQRGYGLPAKEFALFNTKRWNGVETRPACCMVVPTLYEGPMSEAAIYMALDELRESGSLMVPGFMKPEGIVIYHTAANQLFKKTLEKDESPKGLSNG